MPRVNTFDTQGFYAAIDAVRRARGVSWQHIFHKTYVVGCRSAKERQYAPLPQNRAILAQWAGIDAAAFERKVGQA